MTDIDEMINLNNDLNSKFPKYTFDSGPLRNAHLITSVSIFRDDKKLDDIDISHCNNDFSEIESTVRNFLIDSN